MISVIHTPVDEAAAQDEDFYRIPVGGRWMEMDWERVGRAFGDASARLGWDADFELLPERQRVVVRFPKDRVELVGRTMKDFHRLVSEDLGMEQYMSIWIDILSRR
jgi:hypothetical protein